MKWLTVGVDDEKFIQWAERTENAFVHMINTMKDVAEVVRENTIPLTPVETTRLGKSFKTFVLTDTAREKLIMVRMSALNPHTGYDYAWIQHENTEYEHPSKYASRGARDISLDNSLLYYRTGVDLGATNNPRDHYLMEGVIQSEEGAFQLIEEDYLSLFMRGNIF